jgi:hypothetical protein
VTRSCLPCPHLVLFGIALALTACGEAVEPSVPTSRAATQPDIAATLAVPNGACDLLRMADIQRVLPEARAGQRNDDLAEQGVAKCEWPSTSGKWNELELGTWTQDGSDDTPIESARDALMGLADSLRSDAKASIRIETLSGVGDEAVAIVETPDAGKGILSHAAWLTLRKGKRLVTIASSDIARRERALALRQLSELGAAAADNL